LHQPRLATIFGFVNIPLKTKIQTMRRNPTSSFGALHPVLFMLLVYIISVVLAFFVCRMIYFSLHSETSSTEMDLNKIEPLTATR